MAALQQYANLLTELNPLSVAFRLFLAGIVGGLIGLERGRSGHAAGLRTHILVAIGSAMTVIIGCYSVRVLGFSGDPMRVSAQVISGIGFLGAGTIMTRSRSQVTGLTTAAGLWATASIGLAIGLGFYWAALLAFIAVKLTITLLSRLEQHLYTKENPLYYSELNRADAVREFLSELEALKVEVRMVNARSGIPGHIGFNLTVDGDTEAVIKAISALPYVEFILPDSV